MEIRIFGKNGKLKRVIKDRPLFGSQPKKKRRVGLCHEQIEKILSEAAKD